jgi:hypothetical protein
MRTYVSINVLAYRLGMSRVWLKTCAELRLIPFVDMNGKKRFEQEAVLDALAAMAAQNCDTLRPERLVSLAELADALNVPQGWLKAESDGGRLNYLRLGKKYRFNFNPQTVKTVLAARASEDRSKLKAVQLLTVGRIAELLDVPVDRVKYVLRSNPSIKPVALAGRTRLYDRRRFAMIREALRGDTACQD